MARVFGPISWVHRALFWSGAACCALGVALIMLAVGTPRHSPAAASLLIAGLAILSGGSGACVLGWSPRANWVQLDASAVSRPWARGEPSLQLTRLSGIQASTRGGVVLRSTSGPQLRIAADLPGFQELVDLLCDRITDNGYPETAASWPTADGNVAVNARQVSAPWVGQSQPTPVSWDEITELWLARDPRRRLAIALTVAGDRELRFPHIGTTKTLQLYRALRQSLRQRQLRPPTGARRQIQAQIKAERTRLVLLGIVLLGGVAGAVLGARHNGRLRQRH